MTLNPTPLLNFLICKENFLFFFNSVEFDGLCMKVNWLTITD
jgi:hypothetical protein